jgi:lipopolysaccharide/colanic/teichoic acid biosynthesis glycosyltransferase/glycosyltransferase involved in cell wall biosynthesis
MLAAPSLATSRAEPLAATTHLVTTRLAPPAPRAPSGLPGNPRIAILHDYLVHVRGGERVLAALHRRYPSADVFTLVYDRAGLPAGYGVIPAHTSFIQHLPLARRHFRAYLPLYPLAAARLDVRGYDLVISSSSAWVHGARTNPLARHICYCHTPFRFAWNERDTAAGAEALIPAPLARALGPLLASIRARDLAAAHQVDHFVANSHVVRERIARYYGRESTVIHPPVDLDRFQPGEPVEEFYLIVSALVPYKRVDLAVRAFTRLGLPLVVAGDGPERRALQRMAGPSVRFVGRVPDAELSALYARCRALIFTANEDFGITPLEAQAAGRPVLAFGAGGALETVVAGATGAFFPAQDADTLADAVRAFDPDAYDPAAIRRHACEFGEARFAAEFHAYLTDRLEQVPVPSGAGRVVRVGPLPPTPSPFRGGGAGDPHPLAGSLVREGVGAGGHALALPRGGGAGAAAISSGSPPHAGEGLGERFYAVTKRLLDMLGSAAGLVLLSPLFAVLAVLIKLEDGGPVLYRREIVGQEGSRFYALKFRTMLPDAEGYLRAHPDLQREYEANIKLRRDPRITRIGARLRRTSLDELPQLVNVLRGQMSLVGPRMIHPSEEARYGAFAAERRSVRPGITGLWQVSGRQEVSYPQRVALDQQYLRERSLRLDLAILLRTVAVVFRRQGAY